MLFVPLAKTLSKPAPDTSLGERDNLEPPLVSPASNLLAGRQGSDRDAIDDADGGTIADDVQGHFLIPSEHH
ncbi:MAG: hypothetical protein WCI12_08460, partial [Actinomycetes bacterium]